MARLVIVRDGRIQSRVDVLFPTVWIGRDLRNDVILEDATRAVSRFHAEIRREGAGYVIADRNSRNGTWIDGQRVTQEPLRPRHCETRTVRATI
jgi:pSer/pThr/pTyr-binding forkhead associated (FHA) protein